MCATTIDQLIAGSTNMSTTDQGRFTEVHFSRGSAPLGIATLDNNSGAVLNAVTYEPAE